MVVFSLLFVCLMALNSVYLDLLRILLGNIFQLWFRVLMAIVPVWQQLSDYSLPMSHDIMSHLQLSPILLLSLTLLLTLYKPSNLPFSIKEVPIAQPTSLLLFPKSNTILQSTLAINTHQYQPILLLISLNLNNTMISTRILRSQSPPISAIFPVPLNSNLYQKCTINRWKFIKYWSVRLWGLLVGALLCCFGGSAALRVVLISINWGLLLVVNCIKLEIKIKNKNIRKRLKRIRKSRKIKVWTQLTTVSNVVYKTNHNSTINNFKTPTKSHKLRSSKHGSVHFWISFQTPTLTILTKKYQFFKAESHNSLICIILCEIIINVRILLILFWKINWVVLNHWIKYIWNLLLKKVKIINKNVMKL